MQPIQDPSTQWNPPGVANVAQLMQMNATSMAYQPEWSVTNAIGGHYLGLETEDLPLGYTRQQYEEERALAAENMAKGFGAATAQWVGGAAATHFLFTGANHLSSTSVGRLLGAGTSYIGTGLGKAAGAIISAPVAGAANLTIRGAGGLAGSIGSSILGRVGAKAAADSASKLTLAPIANATGKNLLRFGMNAGGMVGGFIGGFFDPITMAASELIERGFDWSSAYFETGSLSRGIQKDMLAKSDRILRFGAASSSMNIQGGMTQSQRAHLADKIEDMAVNEGTRRDLFGSGYGLFGGMKATAERMQELKSILNVGTDMGMFDMSRSMEDFEKKFEQTVKVVDKMSKLIQKSKGEVMALIANIQQSEGIYDLNAISNNIQFKNKAAKVTGADLSTVVMEGAAGSKISSQYGFSNSLGSRFAAESRLDIGRAINNGDLSREALHRLGNEQGAIIAMTDAKMKILQDKSIMAEFAMLMDYKKDPSGKAVIDRDKINALEHMSQDELVQHAYKLRAFVTDEVKSERNGGAIVAGGKFVDALPDVQEALQNGSITDDMVVKVLSNHVKARHAALNRGAAPLTKDEILKQAMYDYGIDPALREILAKKLNGGYLENEYDENLAVLRANRQELYDTKNIGFFEKAGAWTWGQVYGLFSGKGVGRESAAWYLNKEKNINAETARRFVGLDTIEQRYDSYYKTSSKDIKYMLQHGQQDGGLTPEDNQKIRDAASLNSAIDSGIISARTSAGKDFQNALGMSQRLNLDNGKELYWSIDSIRLTGDNEKYKEAVEIVKRAYHGNYTPIKEDQMKNVGFVLGQINEYGKDFADKDEFEEKVFSNIHVTGKDGSDRGSLTDIMKKDLSNALLNQKKGERYGWGDAFSTIGKWTGGSAAIGFAAGGHFLIGGVAGLAVGTVQAIRQFGTIKETSVKKVLTDAVKKAGGDEWGGDMALYDGQKWNSGADIDIAKAMDEWFSAEDIGLSEEDKDKFMEAMSMVKNDFTFKGEKGQILLDDVVKMMEKAPIKDAKDKADMTNAILGMMKASGTGRLKEGGRIYAGAIEEALSLTKSKAAVVAAQVKAQENMERKYARLKEKAEDKLTEEEKRFVLFFEGAGARYYTGTADEAYEKFTGGINSTDPNSITKVNAFFEATGMSEYKGIFTNEYKNLESIKSAVEGHKITLSDDLKNQLYAGEFNTIDDFKKALFTKHGWIDKMIKEGSDANENEGKELTTETSKDGNTKMTADAMEMFYKGSVLINSIGSKLIANGW